MIDVEDFARLRPAVEPLDDATRSRLRAELFPSAVPALVLPGRPGVSGAPARSPDRPLAPARSRRPRSVVLLAAGVAAALLVGAAVIGSDPFGPSTTRIRAGGAGPGGTLPAAATTALAGGTAGERASLSPEPVPLLAVTDGSGWTLANASIRSEPVAPLILARPGRGLDGPIVQVSLSADGLAADGGDRIDGEDQIEVSINGGRGLLSASGDVTSLSWAAPKGGTLLAVAYGLSRPELTAVAEVIGTDDTGRPGLTRPLDGLAPIDDASAAAMAFAASYAFVNTDGRQLLVTLYPGGRFMNAVRIGAEERRPVSFDGEIVPLLDYGQGLGRYRVNLVRGFWAWELDGSPFTDPEEFLSLLDQLVAVDQETWNDLLPPGIIGPPHRPDVVADLIAGLPVPEGFDEDGLAGRPTTDRREAVAEEVVRSVACAWLQTLVGTGGAGGDAVEAAADALGEVSRSATLQEAGVYGTGLPEYLSQLSTQLSSDASTDSTARRARQELACAERGD